MGNLMYPGLQQANQKSMEGLRLDAFRQVSEQGQLADLSDCASADGTCWLDPPISQNAMGNDRQPVDQREDDRDGSAPGCGDVYRVLALRNFGDACSSAMAHYVRGDSQFDPYTSANCPATDSTQPTLDECAREVVGVPSAG
jgi:hypothetical protein